MGKLKDYGASWILLRLPSLTDQILIKAKRIRRLEELKGKSMIPEGVDVEYRGILNYCVTALIKLWYPQRIPSADAFLAGDTKISSSLLGNLYDEVTNRTRQLMCKKDHDYGGAWSEMRMSAITDQILVKIYRIKSIEENTEQPAMSEGTDAHYSDILNYCVFALMKFRKSTI